MKNQKRFEELSVGEGFTVPDSDCIFIKISCSKTNRNALAATKHGTTIYRVNLEDLVIPRDYTIVLNPNTHQE